MGWGSPWSPWCPPGCAVRRPRVPSSLLRNGCVSSSLRGHLARPHVPSTAGTRGPGAGDRCQDTGQASRRWGQTGRAAGFTFSRHDRFPPACPAGASTTPAVPPPTGEIPCQRGGSQKTRLRPWCSWTLNGPFQSRQGTSWVSDPQPSGDSASSKPTPIRLPDAERWEQEFKPEPKSLNQRAWGHESIRSARSLHMCEPSRGHAPTLRPAAAGAGACPRGLGAADAAQHGRLGCGPEPRFRARAPTCRASGA